MHPQNDRLLSAIDLKSCVAKNRFAVAPMTRVTAAGDGRVSENMVRYYERFAKGGFGLVVTEGVYTDQAYSQGYHFQPGLTDDAQARSWKPLVHGIRSHGAIAIAQLMHAGAISQGNRFRGRTVGPSATQPKGSQMTFYYGKDSYPLPDAITYEQIAEAISGVWRRGSAGRRGFGFRRRRNPCRQRISARSIPDRLCQ
jgi:2,4-dienoyl-CoA reductase-like NADH-dependent reductase (Old Yellow Enzyme family)